MKKSEKIQLGICLSILIPLICFYENFFGFGNFIDAHFTSTEQLNFLFSILGIISLFIFFSLIYLIIKLIKSEKMASKFRKEIQVGESVRFNGYQNGNIGELLEIEGDYVLVKVKLPKDRIYPIIVKE